MTHDSMLTCKNCGAPVCPRMEQCPYCEVWYSTQRSRPWSVVTENRDVRARAIYPALFLAGVAIAVYVFLIDFDSFSETTLVRLTPIWVFCVIAGTYGYLAEKALGRVAIGEAQHIAGGYRLVMEEFFKEHPLVGFFLVVLCFPFGYFKMKSVLLSVFIGAAVWGILLLIFFNGIFPAL